MRKYKNALRALVFCLLAAALLVGLRQVFRFKLGGDPEGTSGTTQMEVYYQQPENSVDVLVLGTSHAYRSVSPGLLYEQQGIAAYDLCASSQAIWNTYYYLREGLKTQKPSLIVLEAAGIALIQNDYDLDTSQAEIVASLYGMKFSKNKLAAIRASVAQGEDWLPLLLDWTQYHARYTDLTAADFLPWQGNETYFSSWKGFEADWRVTDCGTLTVTPSDEAKPLYEKTERYYRAILDLAQSEGIPVCVIVTPYPGYNTAAERGYYNTIAGIAAQYGVNYIDFNTEQWYAEMGLDGASDFSDTGHLNYAGAVKFTTAFGAYLRDTYDLPDRSGDAAYASWLESAAYDANRDRDKTLAAETDLTAYLEALADGGDDYTVLLYAAGCDTLTDYTDALEALGIPADSVAAAAAGSGAWAVRGGQLLFDSAGQTGYTWHWQDGYQDLAIVQGDDGTVRLFAGADNYANIGKNGLNILVWDNATGQLADAVGFYALYGYEAERLSR